MQVLALSEISLTYLPGNATRIVAKAVGDFNLGDADTQSSVGGVAVDTSAMTSVNAATAAAASSQQGEYASAEARDAGELE